MTASYRPEYRPFAHDVRGVFADEIRTLGGVVADAFQIDDRFIGRGVLQVDSEIRPGDVVKGGVAVRVSGPEILVHPYTFRVVCTNGAIAAYALGTTRIERIEVASAFQSTYESERTLIEVAEAVRACAAPEIFMTVADDMRAATDMRTNEVLNRTSIVARWPEDLLQRSLGHILNRYLTDGDSSGFGWFNAITAEARDTPDPDIRWRLETFGGECLAAVRGWRSGHAEPLGGELVAGAKLAG